MLNIIRQASHLSTTLLYLLVEKELGDHMKLKRTKYTSCNKPIWSYHEPVLSTCIYQLTLKPFGVVSVFFNSIGI